jgi:multidrug efflux pump subunit AcrB
MIGFIALAGIIVRNSILLVDFIRHARRAGQAAARHVARSRTRSASSRSC